MAYLYKNPQLQQLEEANQQRALLDAERQQLRQRLAWLDARIVEWRLPVGTKPDVRCRPARQTAHTEPNVNRYRCALTPASPVPAEVQLHRHIQAIHRRAYIAP
jgi:hypothetical protein